MVLVDTSVWIEIFRKPTRLRLEDVAGFDDVVTALPIVQEVLQGFTAERPFMHALDSMLALPIVESPLEEALFLEAVQLYRAARRVGLTIRWSCSAVLTQYSASWRRPTSTLVV